MPPFSDSMLQVDDELRILTSRALILLTGVAGGDVPFETGTVCLKETVNLLALFFSFGLPALFKSA